MKKFVFPYESLLKVRQIHEDLAQKEYTDALAEQRKSEKELYDMEEAIRSARQSRFLMQNQSGILDSNIQYIESFIEGTKLKIKSKQLEVEGLKLISQEKYKVFLEKYRDKKAIEKMKEKHQERYKKEYKKYLEKQTDDINTMRRTGND